MSPLHRLGRPSATLLAAAAVTIGLGAAPARARPASTGWFTEGGMGAFGLLGNAQSDAKVGPLAELRLGRDLFSWLSVGVDLAASTHEATVPPPPVDQYFQLYRGAADVQLGGRFDRLALFVNGGVGLGMISTNVLGKVAITEPGEHVSMTLHGGASLEYQLENRHYAIGLAGTFVMWNQFASMPSAGGRVYLRYTY
jgi:hypothetical protein